MTKQIGAFEQFATTKPVIVAATATSILAAILCMNWPEGAAKREHRIETALGHGEVVEIAHADDGARVWAIKRDGKTIYFSNGGVVIDDQSKVGQP